MFEVFVVGIQGRSFDLLFYLVQVDQGPGQILFGKNKKK